MFGAKQDTPDRAARHPDARPFLRHIAGAAPIPTTMGMYPNRPSIFDQGTTMGCESCMLARIIAFALGDKLGWVPSQLASYRIAQMIGRQTFTGDASLPDEGCYTSDMMQGAAIWGTSPMRAEPDPGRYCDMDTTNVRVQEDLIGLQQDSVSLIVGPYRVDPASPDLIDQLRVASAARIPIALVGPVDPSFVNWIAGSAPSGAQAPTAPGHALAANGAFRQLSDGTFEFDVDNSWGPMRGENGVYRVDEAFVRSRWDIYICPMSVSPAPGLLRAA